MNDKIIVLMEYLSYSGWADSHLRRQKKLHKKFHVLKSLCEPRAPYCSHRLIVFDLSRHRFNVNYLLDLMGNHWLVVNKTVFDRCLIGFWCLSTMNDDIFRSHSKMKMTTGAAHCIKFSSQVSVYGGLQNSSDCFTGCLRKS